MNTFVARIARRLRLMSGSAAKVDTPSDDAQLVGIHSRDADGNFIHILVARRKTPSHPSSFTARVRGLG